MTERWMIMLRHDWPYDHGWLIPHNAPVPEPDEQLEIFEVMRVSEVEHLRHAMQDADKMSDDPITIRAILRAALQVSERTSYE